MKHILIVSIISLFFTSCNGSEESYESRNESLKDFRKNNNVSKSPIDYYPEIKGWEIPDVYGKKFAKKGISVVDLRNLINNEIQLGGDRKAMALLSISSMFDEIEGGNANKFSLDAHKISTDYEIFSGYRDTDDGIKALKKLNGNYGNHEEFSRIQKQVPIRYKEYFDKISPSSDYILLNK